MVAEAGEMKASVGRNKTKELSWRKVLADFRASGLSQTEFCKQQGVDLKKFGWWKRELTRRDAAVSTNAPVLKRNKEGELAYWRKILTRFKTGNLSKYEFCEKEGIKPAAFSWWRGELQRRDTARSVDFARPQVSAENMFVPVQVSEPKASRPAAPSPIAEIELSTRTVRIFQAVTTEHLLTLVRLIKELSFDR